MNVSERTVDLMVQLMDRGGMSHKFTEIEFVIYNR